MKREKCNETLYSFRACRTAMDASTEWIWRKNQEL